MTYDQEIDAIFAQARKNMHSAIDKATDELIQETHNDIDRAFNSMEVTEMKHTELLCARPKYIKSDFVWKYYPLFLAGEFASVCLGVVVAVLYFVK